MEPVIHNFRHQLFDPNREHCIPVPLQGTCNSLNRHPGRRSKTRLPLGWYAYPLRGKDGCQFRIEYERDYDASVRVRTIPINSMTTNGLTEIESNPSSEALIQLKLASTEARTAVSSEIRLFPLKGERISAQGKLVRERRPGLQSKTTDLPCKGNGTGDTQFPASIV